MSDLQINAQTRCYGIIGSPVSHSFSPIIHNFLFQKHQLNHVYLAFNVEKAQHAIQAMKTLGIQGFSVTIPHKLSVMEALDEIDPLASQIGAVNTVVNTNGKLTGYNTDGIGAYLAMIDKAFPLENAKIAILGNGGSARAIAFTLLNKVSSCKLLVIGRSKEKTEHFVHELSSQKGNINRVQAYTFDHKDLKNLISSSSIIINTTPIGMTPNHAETVLSKEMISSKHFVYDIVYNPRMTKLLSEAKEQGASILEGITMLINQAVEQFYLFTGIKIKATDITHLF